MFLDLLQRLGVVHERKGIAHHGSQANDLLIAILLVYKHLCELVIRDSTSFEEQTNVVHS